MRFAAFGRTQWLYDSVRVAVSNGHRVALIGTSPAAPEYTVTERSFEILADELRCPFFCDPAINSFKYIQMAKESKSDVAISVNWVTMIGQEMIDQFKYGVINAHSGDLPLYRGNAAPNWAILEGESKIALTLHQMTTQLDEGPILSKQDFPLNTDTYLRDVYNFLTTNIPKMFLEALHGLENALIVPKPQSTDPELSLRCFPRLRRDGAIDWRQPAEMIARLVRASSEPFAGAYTFINSEELIVWRAVAGRLSYRYLGMPGQVVERRSKSGEVVVLTGDGVLVLQEVETALAGRGKAADIVRSMRVRLGIDVAEEIVQLKKRIEKLERFT
jgi:methionyl-tRNA formyltransferase